MRLKCQFNPSKERQKSKTVSIAKHYLCKTLPLHNPLQNITLLKHYWNILRIGPHNRGLLLILQNFSDRKICSTPVHACFSNSNFVRVIDMAIVRSSNSQIFFKNTYVETAGLKFLRMPFFYRASPVAASVLLPICELRTFFKWLYC